MQVEETDEQLIQRMAERDESALLKLHSRYAHQLVAFIGRILSDPDEVMASALDTFAYAWNHAGDFEPEKLSAKAWLVTLCHRIALNHRRGDDLEPMPLQNWHVPARASYPDEDVHHQMRVHDHHDPPEFGLQEASSNVVSELSQTARDYLETAFYGGLSQRQVAAEAGESLDAVRAELHREIHKLRSLRTGGKP